MTIYTYKAVTRSGEVITGEMTVPGLDDLKNRLDYAGLILVDANDQSERSLWAQFGDIAKRYSVVFRRSKDEQSVTTFLQELSILLSANIRLDSALKILGESGDSQYHSIASYIHSAIGTGLSLSEALAKQPEKFDPMTIALIKIGETSGKLAQVLESLAEQRERNATFRRNTIQPLRYPAFLLASALLVLTFFFSHILPQFVDIFKDFDTQADPFVHNLLAFVRWTEVHSLYLRSIFSITIAFVMFAWLSSSVKRIIYDQLSKISFVHALQTQYNTVLFCRLLSLTLQGGIGVTQSITLIVNVIGTNSNKGAWLDVYDKVRHGTALNEALLSAQLISLTAIRFLKIGEETGQLYQLANKSALFHEARLERKLSNITGIIGPAAIIIISSLVGGIIVALMTSLVSLGQVVR